MSRNPDDVHPLDPLNPVGLESQETSQPTISSQQPPASSGGNEDEIEVIRVEIEQTRTEMGDTIDAIQDKLSPEHIAQQARDAAVGRAQEAAAEAAGRAQDAATKAAYRARAVRGSTAQKVRDNRSALLALMGPLMSSLVVLAILIRKRQQEEEVIEPPPPPARFPFLGSLSQRSSGQIGQPINRVRDAVSATTSQAQQVRDQAQSKAVKLAAEAQRRAQQVADQATKNAMRLGAAGKKGTEQATDQAKKASDKVAGKTKATGSQASDTASHAGDSVSAAIAQVVETIRRFAARGQTSVPVPPTHTEQIVSVARENQATLVAAALALILVVAARILDSKREARS